MAGSSTSYLIDYPLSLEGEDHPAPLRQYLKKFILRSKVRVNEASERYDVWQAWGEDVEAERTWKFGSGGSAEPHWDTRGRKVDVAEGEVGCWDLRAGAGKDGLGKRILVAKGQKRELFTGIPSSKARRSRSRI
jgi:hypothetical protein